ncbi:MAG: hypothetical protein IJ507_04055 [Clostridia bacterium]|nr:hypothetical protein [Clostridia bacterium]
MSEDIYEVLSLGMRYWFMLLGLLIVWRAFGWLRRDRREKHRRLRQLPDAGMIGELVVIVGSDELSEGTAIPVPREGVLGFLRTCDVVVPVPGVAAHHLDFTFRDGKGLLLRPWRGCTCQVDADELTHRSKPAQFPMHHGSRLFVGDAVLRLRVFAGLEVTRHVQFAEDEPEDNPQQLQPPAPPAAPWQDTPYAYHQHAPSWQDSGRFPPQPYQPDPWQGTPYQQPAYPPRQNVQPDPWLTDDYPQTNDPVPGYTPPEYIYREPVPAADDPAPVDDFAPAAARTRRSLRQRRYDDEA